MTHIINHFDNHLTQKELLFELLKQVYFIVQNKKHLTRKGLQKIVAIKSLIGLSSQLQLSFLNTIPVQRS